MRTLLLLLITANLTAQHFCGFQGTPFDAPPAPRTGEVIVLPLVFHVMHSAGLGNVSDELIYTIVDELNEAYIDHDIQFCLATNDPLKRPHSGINRVDVTEAFPNYQSISVGTPCLTHSVNQNDVKALSWWPPQHAYQIWIAPAVYFGCNMMGGWAQFPNGQPTDGTVVGANNFNVGAFRPYLFAHEVGHGLGLAHTFYNTQNCNETDCTMQGDLVCDTPPATAPSLGNCANVSCDADPTNIMDYGWTCANHFTEGQGERMRGIINSSVRGLAATSGACGCPFDFDGDGLVTVSDLMVFLSLYGNVYAVSDLLNMLASVGCGG
jgi:hypothetical protein